MEKIFSLFSYANQVRVKNLCPQSQLRSSFNQLYNNRPNIHLFYQSASAALVHGVWTNENLNQFQDCSFDINSNLYSPTERYGRGVFASIISLNLRQDPDGKCIDYIQLTFYDARTQKICGRFTAADEFGQRTFFNEGNGIIRAHIFVNKSIPFDVLHRSAEVNLVFTAYESKFQFELNFFDLNFRLNNFIYTECTSDQNFHKCNPNSDNFCISHVFKNDDIQNCPPPFGSDELKETMSTNINA